MNLRELKGSVSVKSCCVPRRRHGKKKKYPDPKPSSYIIPLSALHDSGPLQSDPYESSTQPLATRFLASRQLQSCWENLSVIQHLLKISMCWLRLGLVKALEFNNVFSFLWQASLYKIKFIFYLLKFWPKWRGTHWFFSIQLSPLLLTSFHLSCHFKKLVMTSDSTESSGDTLLLHLIACC